MLTNFTPSRACREAGMGHEHPDFRETIARYPNLEIEWFEGRTKKFKRRYCMKKLLLLAAAGILILEPNVANAARADASAGKEKAKVVCAPCHGLAGISLVRAYPNLAGQKKQYLIDQLKAFRSGERKSPKMMNPLAAQLSDADIKNLAAYFSGLSGCEDSCSTSGQADPGQIDEPPDTP